MAITPHLDQLPGIGPGVALLRALERGGSGVSTIPEWELSTVSWRLFSWAQSVRDNGSAVERDLLYRVLADDPRVALEIRDGRVEANELDGATHGVR